MALPVLVDTGVRRHGAQARKKKSRSFDCERSFSFAEICHGSHIGKQIFCVTCTISLAPLESQDANVNRLQAARKKSTCCWSCHETCTVRDDPACHTSNASCWFLPLLCYAGSTISPPGQPAGCMHCVSTRTSWAQDEEMGPKSQGLARRF